MNFQPTPVLKPQARFQVAGALTSTQIVVAIKAKETPTLTHFQSRDERSHRRRKRAWE